MHTAERFFRHRTKLITVHAYVPSNGICRGFAFKYGKFLLPPRFLTALSVPKVPIREQLRKNASCIYPLFTVSSLQEPLYNPYNSPPKASAYPDHTGTSTCSVRSAGSPLSSSSSPVPPGRGISLTGNGAEAGTYAHSC